MTTTQRLETKLHETNSRILEIAELTIIFMDGIFMGGKPKIKMSAEKRKLLIKEQKTLMVLKATLNRFIMREHFKNLKGGK